MKITIERSHTGTRTQIPLLFLVIAGSFVIWWRCKNYSLNWHHCILLWKFWHSWRNSEIYTRSACQEINRYWLTRSFNAVFSSVTHGDTEFSAHPFTLLFNLTLRESACYVKHTRLSKLNYFVKPIPCTCMLFKRPCSLNFRNKCKLPWRSADGYSPASHLDGQVSILDHAVWDFWWEKLALVSTSFSPASFHSCSCSILFYNRRYVFSTPTGSLSNTRRKSKQQHISFPPFCWLSHLIFRGFSAAMKFSEKNRLWKPSYVTS
jgi:hypothetical protein